MDELHEKIKLKTGISNLQNKALTKQIEIYLKKHPKIICKGLNRRPVIIQEFLNFSKQRGGSDENHRKRAFFSVIELLKRVAKDDISNTTIDNRGNIGYEFKGLSRKGNLIGAHIKELKERGDKQLYLISIFWKE